MTIQAIDGLGFLSVGAKIGPGSTSGSGNILDASGEKYAAIFQAPRGGSIRKIIWPTNTVTTGGDVDVRVETVSGIYPSGTLWGTTTNATHTVSASDDNVWLTTTLTSDASVAEGDSVAIVIVRGAAGNVQIRGTSSSNASTGYPRSCLYTTSWAVLTNHSQILVEYSDGEKYPTGISVGHTTAGTATAAISSSTTPDELGNYFIPAFACRLSGVYVLALASTTATFDVIVYSAANDVLASVSCATEFLQGTIFNHFIKLTADYDLVAGTTYRIVLKPTTTNTVTLHRTTLTSGAQTRLGANFYRTQRTDNGAWSELSTEIVEMFPVFAGFDDGASAGGMIVHPGMNGGMHG